MADVEALCKRVIVIHHGKILFNGDLSGLVQKFSSYKTIGITLESNGCDLSSFGEIMSKDGLRVTLRVSKSETSRVTAKLLNELNIYDLTIEDTPIDDVIEKVFAQG
jgi:ABC-2 type transport system ATP-binding protein